MHSIRIACRRWYNINPHICQRSLSSSTAVSSPSPTISTTSSSLHYDRDTGIIWEKTLSLSDIQKKPIYQTIIGIEIHAQLSIPTKLFSSAPTRHHYETNNNNINTSSALPNTNVHPYDIAYPGTLPSSPSISAIKSSILASAVLNCNINKISRFERKHYFYPDLPTGYQITQQRWPLASDGMIKFMPTSSSSNADVSDKKVGKKKKRRRGGSSNDDDVNVDQKQMQDNKSSSTTNIIKPVELRIERIQLEQDTGKTTTHIIRNGGDKNTTITKSYIDYNRAGSALIEIVSHPDLRSAHEASGAVEHIRKLLKHVGSCDGRMEEGSLRCDLNVSIAPIVDDESEVNTNCSIYNRQELPLNTGERVEVKNLNSLRQIIAATEYEALRQSSLAESGTPTGRETRTWNVKPTSESHPLGGETFCIRAKGDAIDYRFMPEPDLPPLVLDGETLGYGSSDKNMSLEEYIEMHMPESAEDGKLRLINEYSLTEDVASVITGDPPAIALFELTVQTAKSELESMRSEDINKADMKRLSTLAANWLCNDLFALVKKSAIKDIDESSEGGLNHPISVEYSTVDGQRLGSLIAMLANDLLTTPMAKKVLNIMYEERDSQSHPTDIAKTNGWEVISDLETLVQLCESVVLDSKNAGQLEQYKLGGKKVWKIEKFFVGKIMGASKGNAHPERMKEALSVVLSKVGL